MAIWSDLSNFVQGLLHGYGFDGTNWQALATDVNGNLKIKITNLVNVPSDYILIQDQKPQNTNGGTFTTGAWRTRDLNTKVIDTGGFATIATNQITLLAGTYRINASAPAYAVGVHKTRLQNISDGTSLLLGSSEYSPQIAGIPSYTTRSFISGRFIITSTKVLELQHQCAVTNITVGYGVASNFDIEIYSIIELTREL